MIIDENELNGESHEVIAKARKIVKGNAEKLARVVAIAVLGEDYYITEISGSKQIKRRKDDKELDRLTDLFLHSVKPSKLTVIAAAITNISNLADFITSMRLLSGARTTQPIKNRIE
jgi:hypothetical protein